MPSPAPSIHRPTDAWIDHTIKGVRRCRCVDRLRTHQYRNEKACSSWKKTYTTSRNVQTGLNLMTHRRPTPNATFTMGLIFEYETEGMRWIK
jgi:hypothetical protein